MLGGTFVRLVGLCLALLVAACFGGRSAELAAEDDDPSPGGGAPGFAACSTDSECVPAAATCCECPTFATSTDDPKAGVCSDIDCPTNSCPDNVEAACNTDVGACELRCKPLACDLSCAGGFAVDANGCLSCACAGPPPQGSDNGCQRDADCVQTRADCCGCAGGGEDTAVLASEAQRFDADLMCGSSPACPGVDTCDPALAPRCVAGSCALLPEPPIGACGRPDLPACPAGQVCIVNASDPANLYGVGLCQTP